MDILQPQSENRINRLIAGSLKIYPEFATYLEFHDPFRIRQSNWEARNDGRIHNYQLVKHLIDNEAINEINSRRRSKQHIRDYILSNKFDLFATFTFAKERYNEDYNRSRINTWIRNQKSINGSFQYLLIPEYHKDGAIHFHGLFERFSGNLRQTAIKKQGRNIYNITSFRLGHSTALYIPDRDREKVATYVSKYVTKELTKTKNQKRYYHSKGLKKPIKIINPTMEQLGKYNLEEKYANDIFRIFRATIKKAGNPTGSPA
jgi:hypothetical protein